MTDSPLVEAERTRPDETLARVSTLIQRGECVLFLGAGISLDSGAPTAQELADELASEFLSAPKGEYDLATAAELIDAVEGRKTLNEWLDRRLGNLKPSSAIEAIPLLHWKSIYTMNYDTLVEQAYQGCPPRAQKLRPFYSNKDPLARLEADEVPLYKLHGCLTRANTDDGHLTLTREDYDHVAKTRLRLLNRLIDDTSDYTMLYVGFRRSDSDFVQIMITVETAAGALLGLRRGYALQPGFNDFEAQRWEQKRVTLINLTATEFFEELLRLLPEDKRFVGSAPDGATAHPALVSKPKLSADVLTAVAKNAEIIDDRVRLTEPDAESFFLGAPPTWQTVLEGADARRDVTDEILSEVLLDPALDTRTVQCVLIHAEAGAGKTTLLRRLAIDLAFQWDRLVISRKPYGDLEFLDVERLASQADERVYVCIDNATAIARELSEFVRSALTAKARITVIAAARTNEWREIASAFPLPAFAEFELGVLSLSEIDGVLNRLEAHGALGRLTGMSHEAQVQAFHSRAQKQLLVALREATEGDDFDKIVVDEYDRIPTPDGQRAYLLVAALHRFGMLTRAALLHRALDIPLTELGDRVFGPTTKVIIPRTVQDDPEYYYSARHTLIAGIVFDRKIPNERRRLEFYKQLIGHLDLGYNSDRAIYQQLTRGTNRELLRDFDDPSNRRQVMEELLALDPGDAWAWQHASMMELDLGDLSAAARYLRKAIDLRPGDPIIRDTEGRLALRVAKSVSDPVTADTRFGQAEDIFRRNINRRPQEPYGYRSLAETYYEWSKIHGEGTRRNEYVRLAYQTLLEGLETCSSIGMLLQYQGELEEKMGNTEGARESFQAALGRDPTSLPLRFMAARLEERDGDLQRALALLEAGLDTSAGSAELHYRVAILLAKVGPERDGEIRAHFQAATLGPNRNYRARLAYAAYLFSQREYQAAADQFARLDDLVVTSRERFEAHRFSFDRLGGMHDGRVNRMSYDTGWIEFDQGAARVFFRAKELPQHVRERLRPGAVVKFALGFNLKGAVALDVEPGASAQ